MRAFQTANDSHPDVASCCVDAPPRLWSGRCHAGRGDDRDGGVGWTEFAAQRSNRGRDAFGPRAARVRTNAY